MYSFCLTAEQYRAKCSQNVTLKVILACTRASCSGSKQLSRVNYTFPHSTRVVLMSCGCFGFVRYVSDFIYAVVFKIVSSYSLCRGCLHVSVSAGTLFSARHSVHMHRRLARAYSLSCRWPPLLERSLQLLLAVHLLGMAHKDSA